MWHQKLGGKAQLDGTLPLNCNDKYQLIKYCNRQQQNSWLHDACLQSNDRYAPCCSLWEQPWVRSQWERPASLACVGTAFPLSHAARFFHCDSSERRPHKTRSITDHTRARTCTHTRTCTPQLYTAAGLSADVPQRGRRG